MIRHIYDGEITIVVVRPARAAMDKSPDAATIMRRLYAINGTKKTEANREQHTPQRIVVGFDVAHHQELAELKYPNREHRAYLPSEKLSIG